MSSETLAQEETDQEIGDVEELLVEEVSIDGLCGVY
ncbi:MAG: mycofactocin precursor MftA [Acidimicrobiales bacterium]